MDSCADNPFSEIKLFSRHTDIVRFLVCIDDFRCCSAGDDGLIVIWDFEDGRLLHELQGHSRPITSVVPMSCSKLESKHNLKRLLISSSSDKLILIWDADLGILLKKFTDHCSTAKCLDTMPSCNNHFCSGGEKLCLWNISDLRLVNMIPATTVEDIHLILAMPNNSIIAAADRQIAVFTCRREQENSEMLLEFSCRFDAHRELIRSLIRVDDRSFASGSLDGAILQWSLQTLDVIRRYNFMDEFDSHIYPNSVQHMTCIDNTYLVCAIGSGFRIFDSSTGETLLEKNNVHDGKVLCVKPVFYDSLVATCSEDGTVKLWGNASILRGDSAVTDSPVGSPVKGGLRTGFLSNFAQRKTEKLAVSEIGICTVHSGAVQCCLSLPGGRFVSTGMDAVIILWMDGLAENCKNDREIRDALFKISNIAS